MAFLGGDFVLPGCVQYLLRKLHMIWHTHTHTQRERARERERERERETDRETERETYMFKPTCFAYTWHGEGTKGYITTCAIF